MIIMLTLIVTWNRFTESKEQNVDKWKKINNKTELINMVLLNINNNILCLRFLDSIIDN